MQYIIWKYTKIHNIDDGGDCKNMLVVYAYCYIIIIYYTIYGENMENT